MESEIADMEDISSDILTLGAKSSSIVSHSYIDQYPFMADHLGSDQGIKLMHTDSQIATHIINGFVTNNKPILPIHDSFIVKADDAEYLGTLMMRDIENVVGDWIEIDFN